jgi:hypothetical protein
VNTITLQSLDVVDYIVNNELEKVAEVASTLSEKSRMATIPSYEDELERNEKDFALILWNPRSGQMRKFALYTPELVELNMALLASKVDELPEEVTKTAAANLTSAAYNFKLEVPKELVKLSSTQFVNNIVDTRKVTPVMQKRASISKFAWATDEKFPLETDMHVKQAAAYFEKNHYRMPMEKKAEFIVNVIDAAKEKDISLGKTALEKYSSLQKTKFNPDFYDHIQIRKGYLKDNDEELKTAYDEIIKKADELGPQKTAMVLSKVDEKANLLGSYGKGLEDPFLSTFLEEKVASRTIDGVSVTQDQLSAIPSASLTGVIGEGHIGALKGESGLDVLESLPTPFRRGVLDLV